MASGAILQVFRLPGIGLLRPSADNRGDQKSRANQESST
jgi:hypothetical protein